MYLYQKSFDAVKAEKLDHAALRNQYIKWLSANNIEILTLSMPVYFVWLLFLTNNFAGPNCYCLPHFFSLFKWKLWNLTSILNSRSDIFDAIFVKKNETFSDFTYFLIINHARVSFNYLLLKHIYFEIHNYWTNVAQVYIHIVHFFIINWVTSLSTFIPHMWNKRPQAITVT